MVNRATKKELPPKAGNPVFYQYIQRMALGPYPTPMNKIMYSLQFSVTEEEFALRSYRTIPEGQLLSAENQFDGSLSYRVRCCTARHDNKTMSESDWVTSNTQWPKNIFITVNDKPVFVRRQSHNGKDLPASVTELIQLGLNHVQVAIPEESHRSGPRPNFFFGVEIIETAHCNRTVDYIKRYGVEDASVTINKINSRLQSTYVEDDEFAVLQDSISVDLADPFSAKIFRIPVRGVQCQHIECFDLFNWLNTRPAGASATSNCQHQFTCKCPKAQEPTVPDKWRCPICSRDARPSSLRIDRFLVDVRAKLKEMGKLDKVKSILVGVNGSWDPVTVDDEGENDENEDAGDNSAKRKADNKSADQPTQKLARTDSDTSVSTSARRTASATQPARLIDIIEIDD
ncbi:hypothetical protein SEUCBS140593_008474 [Sporothrix eucalyptigena]|uniref:SP-RING-type domain-containing protein n=1 Tax=Sporothrix eucalyptigena TaxID=1812306 RepID=A0ABP0CNV7_9PEZI